MDDDRVFQTVLHGGLDAITIPWSFYQRWGDRLSNTATLEDDHRNIFIAFVVSKDQSAHFYVNEFRLSWMYNLEDSLKMTFFYQFGNHFTFTIEGQYMGPLDLTDPYLGTIHPGFHLDPLWTTTITKSMANNKHPQALLVPAHVVRHFFKEERPTEILVYVSPKDVEETWKLIWDKARPILCHLGVGWYEFVKNHPLHVGDKLYFWKDTITVAIVFTLNDNLY